MRIFSDHIRHIRRIQVDFYGQIYFIYGFSAKKIESQGLCDWVTVTPRSDEFIQSFFWRHQSYNFFINLSLENLRHFWVLHSLVCVRVRLSFSWHVIPSVQPLFVEQTLLRLMEPLPHDLLHVVDHWVHPDTSHSQASTNSLPIIKSTKNCIFASIKTITWV